MLSINWMKFHKFTRYVMLKMWEFELKNEKNFQTPPKIIEEEDTPPQIPLLSVGKGSNFLSNISPSPAKFQKIRLCSRISCSLTGFLRQFWFVAIFWIVNERPKRLHDGSSRWSLLCSDPWKVNIRSLWYWPLLAYICKLLTRSVLYVLLFDDLY